MEQKEHKQTEETFQYTYSANEQEEVKRIREKYLPREEDKMAQLRKLDAGVSRKATMRSLVVGMTGALLLGIGMSLCMTDIGATIGLAGISMAVGIVIGIAGMVLVGAAYPVYYRVLKREREKAAPEIMRLTEELMK